MQVLMKSIASMLMITISFLPIHSYAYSHKTDDEISSIGKQAQSIGENLASSLKENSSKSANGKISIPSLSSGQFQTNGANSLNVNDLFPGTSGSNDKPDSYYFPDGNKPDISNLTELYNSSRSMGNVGSTSNDSLDEDAKSDSPSLAGQAYKILLDASNRSRPDFSQDPLLNLSKKTYENMDLISDGFGDCSAETVINKEEMNTHVPEYAHCQRVEDKASDCEVLHRYDASVIKHYDGPYNLKSCGEGCDQLWIGRVGNDYWSGHCKIYEERTRVQMINPEAISSATLEYTKWDDYMQVWIGKTGSEKKVWQGPNHNFPPETRGSCELSTSWSKNPNVDVTRYFKNAKKGDIISFKIRTSVTGGGEGYGRIKIHYDPKKAMMNDEWSPQSCIDSAKGIIDGFAKGSITCIDTPSVSNNCTVIDGMKICNSVLKPSPLPNISRFCRKVRITANYNFNKGKMDCWIDAKGDKQCPTNNGEQPDTCQKFENNPKCGFISSKCIDGAQGQSGNCYVHEDTYDCGNDVAVPTLKKETDYKCAGAIRCMGDDCIDLSKSQSTDFARATALLNAAQFMTQDMQCTGQDENGDISGNNNVTCSAFHGESGECKVAVGGVSDCCEKPTNISFADYLTLLMAVPKLDGAVMSLDEGNVIKGAYQTLREPIMEGWTEITKPITSYAENISGAVDSFVDTIDTFVDELKSELKEQVKKIIQNVYQSATKDIGTDAATSASAGKAADKAAQTATDSIMNTATSALSTVMSVYTAYVVAITMVKMVYKCEESEYTVNTKRALKSCTHVGSYCKSKVLGVCIEERQAYCCFNSPLSRIIQEQVRPQLGMSFGDPRNPQCGGIPLDKISQIDWNKIDLDEWLGILKQNGKYPDSSSLNLDTLTGSGSVFNVDNTRKDTQERSVERLKNIDVDEKRREATDLLTLPTNSY